MTVPTYPYAEWAADPEAHSHGAELWGQDGDEVYSHEDLDEAIDEALADWRSQEHLTGPLTMVGLRQQEISASERNNLAERVLDGLLEGLDSDYGDPEGGESERTPAAVAAAEALVDAVLIDFRVWACDVVVRVEVDVQAWVREHQPEWLT